MEVLESPALVMKDNNEGLSDLKIKILINGMESIDDFQIRYSNTEAIEGNLIESKQNSNIFKMKMDVYYKMSFLNL